MLQLKTCGLLHTVCLNYCILVRDKAPGVLRLTQSVWHSERGAEQFDGHRQEWFPVALCGADLGGISPVPNVPLWPLYWRLYTYLGAKHLAYLMVILIANQKAAVCNSVMCLFSQGHFGSLSLKFTGNAAVDLVSLSLFLLKNLKSR